MVIVSLCARMVTSFGCAHHISRASKRENVLASCAGLSGHSVTGSKTAVRKPLFNLCNAQVMKVVCIVTPAHGVTY